MVKGRLLDQFYQEWNANLEISSKGRNYRIFKNDPSLEIYLFKLPKSFYIKQAKFQTGNHRFPCETGRYQGIDYSERKCTLCDNNDIGDEMHYFLICPFFQQQRAEYLPKYYYTRPNKVERYVSIYRYPFAVSQMRNAHKTRRIFIRTSCTHAQTKPPSNTNKYELVRW